MKALTYFFERLFTSEKTDRICNVFLLLTVIYFLTVISISIIQKNIIL